MRSLIHQPPPPPAICLRILPDPPHSDGMTPARGNFHFNNGGRAAAGFKDETGDCVCRAISIATDQPYRTVFDNLSALGWFPGKMKRDADGLYRSRPDNENQLIREYLATLGWAWTPTMRIGSGCKVHLRADELPLGRLIVSVSHHLVAVIDGVIHDNHDCSRNGTRCVYGYWAPA
jgi:hypothetical protein